MDNRLDGQYHLVGAQKAAALALQCLSSDPKYRPSMTQVVSALNQLQDSYGMAKEPSLPEQKGSIDNNSHIPYQCRQRNPMEGFEALARYAAKVIR
ncbi:hypothetical protein HPP92_006347 [Vanilla planifolia]|uniref:Uncharacterized protein n=1 Tax=Vanilla planifolia TaxID=51239 RepID=A0A835RE76_VANPL|nr:hypothetical protein HPP92_006347 [Vanilla planifolia]